MKPQATLAHLLGSTESLSFSKPIANKKLKGKSTKGMVRVKMGDDNNTVIFCETKEEAERVAPIYKAAMMDTETRTRAAKSDKDLSDIVDRHLHRQ